MSDLGSKRCTKCGAVKSLDQFPIRKDRGNKPRSHCKPCHNAHAKTDHSKRLQLIWRYQAKYGLTVDEVDDMRRRQLNACAVCRETFGDTSPHIDHDHATGQVRGILCGNCNKGIGHFRDDPAHLIAAAHYLMSSKSDRAETR